MKRVFREVVTGEVKKETLMLDKPKAIIRPIY